MAQSKLAVVQQIRLTSAVRRKPAVRGFAAYATLRLSALSHYGPSSAGPRKGRRWNESIARYHYLDYRTPVGAQMRHAVHDRDG